jgi:BON domain
MRRLIVGLAVATIATLSPLAASAGDQEAAQQIANNMKASGRLHGYSIGVKVQDRVVWLEGTVTSQQQMAAALDVVQHTPGITKIMNGMSVAPPAADASQQAAQAIQPQLAPRPLPAPTASRSAAAARPAIGGAVRQAGGQGIEGNAQLAVGAQADYDAEAPASVAPAGQGSNAPRPLMPSQLSSPQAARLASNQAPAPMAPQGMAAQPITRQMPPNGAPIPAYAPGPGGSVAPARFDHPYMPGYAWPSYASYPNYAAVTYPKQYSPTAWPFIGPFYPYPQVPLGWRKVSLEWHNGWWMMDFRD